MPDVTDGGSAAAQEGGSPDKADNNDDKRRSRPRRRRRGRKSSSASTSVSSDQDNPEKPAANPGNKNTRTRHPAGRNRHRRGRFAHTYAALDLGTNNCRLLVARPQKEGFKIIDAFSRTVRLGAGLKSSENGEGALTDEAMDRALEALKICAEKIKRRGVTRARCITTEACRTASNGAEFIARVKVETGLELEIITPERESVLAVSGCSPLLDTDCEAAMVFDIGGGSTELVWLDLAPMREAAGEPKIIAWTSLPFGVVTLAESYPDRIPANREEEQALFEEMVTRVRTEIENYTGADHQRELYKTSSAHLIGNSGTVTTLAAVHLGLKSYDRRKVDGLWIKGQSLFDLVSNLSQIGVEGRTKIPSVGADRADLLFPGCAILRAIQETWPAQRVRVADRGLREGILVELMEEAERDIKQGGRTRRGNRGGNRASGSKSTNKGANRAGRSGGSKNQDPVKADRSDNTSTTNPNGED